MRRILCVALAIAALGAFLGTGGGWPSGQAGAATTACVWVKHTKRVVTHVTRHGRRTRVVRLEHSRTCRKVAVPSEPTPTAPTTTVPAPSSSPTPPPAPPGESPVVVPTPEPEPEANALGIAADDRGGHKSFTPSRQTVRAGRLTVQLQNDGEDPHDMDMRRVNGAGEPIGEVVEVPVTAPGEQKTQSVNVEPGEYRMWCNLFHHAEEGMETHVTVE